MISKSKVLIIVLVFAIGLMPTIASADVLFNNVCSGSGSNSTVCQERVSGSNPSSNPLIGPNGLLLKISFIIATIAGIAAVIVIIVSGLRFITSGGDPAKTPRCRRCTKSVLSSALSSLFWPRVLLGLY